MFAKPSEPPAPTSSIFRLIPPTPDQGPGQALTPIEQAFAKPKTLLRAANERSVASLWSRIGHLLAQFEPSECLNYIRNSGYIQSE